MRNVNPEWYYGWDQEPEVEEVDLDETCPDCADAGAVCPDCDGYRAG